MCKSYRKSAVIITVEMKMSYEINWKLTELL